MILLMVECSGETKTIWNVDTDIGLGIKEVYIEEWIW